MSTAIGTALILAVGTTGGLLAHRFRLPGGAILGAILAVGALQLAVTTLPALPTSVRIGAQVLIGTVIGASVSRRPLAALRGIAGHILWLAVVLLVVAVVSAFVFRHVSDLPLLTAVFSTAPGGASDMTAAALEFESDAALIAGFHLVRQLAIFVVIAGVFERYLRRTDGSL